MAVPTLYPGKVNSPITQLVIAITDTATTLTLENASVLPPGPNIAVLGDEEDAETILYTSITGNSLTGVTRGFQGIAKAWSPQTPVARRFTAYDYDSIRATLAELLNGLATSVEATLTNGLYAKIAYPAGFNSSNTYVPTVKCSVNGVKKQLSKLSVNFTDTDISCVLPEVSTSCTFILQRV
ncbi:hypothetical protein D3C75_158490 [compost metagenome]